MAARKVVASIGLLTLPLRLEKAVDDEGNSTHTVCAGTDEEPHDPTRVNQTVACPVCDKSASSHYGFPLRGTENAEGQLVVLSTEEIAEAKGTPITAKAEAPTPIAFHPREKVYGSTVFSGSVNNLTPDKGGDRAYAALHRTLRDHPELVAVFIWAPRTNNTLWAVEATEDGRLIASSLAWPEVVRVAPAVAPVELLDAEMSMFEQLVEGFTTDFDLGAYVNTSKQGLAELVAARSGTAIPSVSSSPLSAGGDMMAALQASLAAAPPKTTVKAVKKAVAKRAPAKKKVAPATPLPQTA